MASGIYRIKNKISGSCYVGSAQDLNGRWRSHKHSLRHKKKSPPKLQRAWDKYGETAFEFSVLEECPREVLLDREQHYIEQYKPRYNTRIQAKSNIGVKWSDDTNRKKAGLARTHTVRGVTGSVSYLAKFFGVVTKQGAYDRLGQGMSIEEAVTAQPIPHMERGRKRGPTVKHAARFRRYSAFGQTGTLTELHRAFGVTTYYVLRSRKNRGWEIERALTQPVQDRA